MRRNKLLLLWSSVGVLVLLMLAAGQENLGKEWRRLQRGAGARSSAERVPIRLRQVVAPELKLADRCVSCHVGMAPGETVPALDPVIGPHTDVVHDPAEFGCTTCHAGQGRATEKADAHGRVPHWPQPMIPIEYAEAGCGTCHTFGQVPDYGQLTRGLHLVEQFDCLACHGMDGRGGTLRPGAAAGVPGPDLSLAGARGYRTDWYAHHLSERESEVLDSSWKASMAPIPPADLEAIELAIRSRVGAPKLIEAKALFLSRGCLGCHKLWGVGGDDGPELTNVGNRDPGQTNFAHVRGERSIAAWFAEHFRNPTKVVPGSLMPAVDLSEQQIELLTLYMLSLRRHDLPQRFWPTDRLETVRLGLSEFARDSKTLYAALCSACHGARGEGMRYAGMASFPAIAAPDFLRTASDTFIFETIRRGRPGRRMSAWGGDAGTLSDEEIRGLVAYLRELGRVAEPAAHPIYVLDRADPDRGKRLYAVACAGCHGVAGEGLEGPALSNQIFLETASDWYIAETIRAGRSGTTMEAFSQPSVTRPALSDDEIASVVSYIRSWEVSR